MHCPTCGEYGDLVLLKVKRTGAQVIACTECDSLWKTVDVTTLGEPLLDVADYLREHHLPPKWSELELLRRV
ncbi:hypothetical protein JFV28_22170 [Pseudomonas sp. TH05]|uniref:hypothetical protein n=1 Tax=unclassified Pseudomonas TaxID=196821 RepID=UPI00099669DE|nr:MULTISPECIES: hypothetical protein [unclassified Pseudomonas]MBK5542450.1 hypothetical protein [Pseudomonas sp. TH07]MBK5558544.1 hypothetical protein [Pseudomonas sp. TH05]OOV90822.1 hypothetical protein MF4836_29520 [Pseudomonas sp. MF4836]